MKHDEERVRDTSSMGIHTSLANPHLGGEYE